MIRGAWYWIARHRAEFGFGLRLTLAALLSFVAGHLLGLEQTWWAVLTAIFVTQASIGGSLKATIDRFIGTVIGAVWGAAVALLVPHAAMLTTVAALAIALIPLAVMLAMRPNYRVAPVTAMIMLLGPFGATGVLSAALERIAEITLGSIIALAVALSASASRAHRLLCQSVADAIVPMREQLELLLRGVASPIEPAAIVRLHDRIRGSLERAAATASEAARERTVHLTGDPDPEPLMRALRRLSHDLAIISRAVAAPLPEPIAGRLAEPARGVAAAVSDFLDRLGRPLTSRSPPPPFDAVHQAFGPYEAAMAALRRDGLTRSLAAEEAERVFGLGFALQQMRANLEELAARVREFAE